jgi:hypothetical protein
MTELLILASEGAEGIPGTHIAAKIAFPVGVVIFCGSVFLLLWSNYGAKKGALVYSTAFFGFCMMLGVFWWFGAPGTPTATGLQNFPGQPSDAYASKWYPFEPGSGRAEYFPSTQDIGNFETVQDELGMQGASEEELEGDPAYASLQGSVTQAGALMADLYLRVEDGEQNLGGERRAEYIETAEAGLQEQAGDAADDYVRADPFFTAAMQDEEVLVNIEDGVQLAGGRVVVTATFTPGEDAEGEDVTVEVDTAEMFAFQQGSNLWFPSAVWTIVSLVLFVLSLFALDRMEQREKKALEEVAEPERLAVPIRQ